MFRQRVCFKRFNAALRKVTAILAALSLAAPAPAFALRQTNAGMEESPTGKEFKERLLEQTAPQTGLEEGDKPGSEGAPRTNLLNLLRAVHEKAVSDLEQQRNAERARLLVAQPRSLEERVELLAKLKARIEEKQQEWLAAVAQDSGAKRDQERALLRIGRISDIADYLLRTYPGRPELFDSYVDRFAYPLLANPAETVNFSLVHPDIQVPYGRLAEGSQETSSLTAVRYESAATSVVALVSEPSRIVEESARCSYLPSFPGLSWK